MNVVLNIPPEEIRAEMKAFFGDLRAELRAEMVASRRETIRELLRDPEIRGMLMGEILNELRLPAGGIRDLVGVSERTLRRWTETGRLEASPEDLPGPPLYRVGDVLDLTTPAPKASSRVPKRDRTPTLNPLEVLAGHASSNRPRKPTRA